MNIFTKITYRFFPLIIIILILIGNSCLLSPKDRTNQLDVSIDDTVFTLTYEMFSPDNNPTDPKVLLSWELVRHDLVAGYTVYRRDKNIIIETTYDTTYDTTLIGIDTDVDTYPEQVSIESTFVIDSTDYLTATYLDTLFHIGENLETDYAVEVYFYDTDFSYFSNHVVIE